MKAFLVAFLLLCGIHTPAFAVEENGRIPVLLYHVWNQGGCNYENNELLAFAADLEILYEHGWTIIPASFVAEWVAGERDGSTLPEKSIAITLDDGAENEWYDSYDSPCGYIPSVYTALLNFKRAHPDLPSYSPSVTTFVIASPVVRKTWGIRDDWWWLAQNTSGGMMEVHNHSADHDMESITHKLWDPDLLSFMRVGSIVDESWDRPTHDFKRINSLSTATVEVARAASFIASKTGVWPTLFAYPFGQASEYLKHDYMPNNKEHGTYAAFCLGGLAWEAATQKSDRFCIPRYVFTAHWKNTDEFIKKVLQEPEERHHKSYCSEENMCR